MSKKFPQVASIGPYDLKWSKWPKMIHMTSNQSIWCQMAHMTSNGSILPWMPIWYQIAQIQMTLNGGYDLELPIWNQMAPYDLKWPIWPQMAHMTSNGPILPQMAPYDLKWPNMTTNRPVWLLSFKIYPYHFETSNSKTSSCLNLKDLDYLVAMTLISPY